MNQNTALDTLRELAEKDVENAAVRLGEMRRGFQQAEEQLNMLIGYQFEYRNSLNDSMSQGIASTRWQNYQQFIQTLEKAIDQHRQQLTQWTSKVEQALNFWQEKQKRLQAWQTLRDRRAAERLLAENKLDQKLMDEYAQRATMRKSQ
ncbi:flagellar export protein FliJ [Dryocola sp. LX212]|jgi:flagellar FliJ protein